MAKKPSSADSFLKTWPKTKKIKDPANPTIGGFEIRDCYIGPFAAKISNILTGIFVAWLAFEWFTTVEYKEDPDFFYALFPGLALCGYVIWRFWRWLLQRMFVIRLFADRMEVAGMNSFLEFRPLERIQFLTKMPDFGEIEQLERQRNPRLFGYFLNSKQVYLYCMNEPFLLGCFYPKEKADIFVGRLERIKNILDLEQNFKDND